VVGESLDARVQHHRGRAERLRGADLLRQLRGGHREGVDRTGRQSAGLGRLRHPVRVRQSARAAVPVGDDPRGRPGRAAQHAVFRDPRGRGQRRVHAVRRAVRAVGARGCRSGAPVPARTGVEAVGLHPRRLQEEQRQPRRVLRARRGRRAVPVLRRRERPARRRAVHVRPAGFYRTSALEDGDKLSSTVVVGLSDTTHEKLAIAEGETVAYYEDDGGEVYRLRIERTAGNDELRVAVARKVQ
jgi:hypothetical protein